ncbi:hypothetical protein GLOTRDRAFT_92700 [Gloeophyllum trabeum ATCC 11539]|uniref:Uncharacterized protein n=1 Tax=Gloeophyllum trabeum (strain ATCC 11539 / FP-39264 / Madison 617) TaxID=670483 RepID=S7Q9G1_GLOTA|nr:uncharacterized protein GLOTRDRAFT_92700 [Gloeophyllum trabeum ATCC 11539]EPQ56157.1 hypothetical protein GLOTRDRAFT_92700 [Gloeophyllum trabeum ATCC 11539]
MRWHDTIVQERIPGPSRHHRALMAEYKGAISLSSGQRNGDCSLTTFLPRKSNVNCAVWLKEDLQSPEVFQNNDKHPQKASVRGMKAKQTVSQNRDAPDVDPPKTSRYLPKAKPSTHWHGRNSLKNIIVFGDSYSSPTAEDDEFTDENAYRWTDHISNALTNVSARVHNFAAPGVTVEATSLHSFPDTCSPELRTARRTRLKALTFICPPVPYIGINGCSRTPSDDLAPLVESLLDAVHNLYTEFETGPIHRSSGGSKTHSCLRYILTLP